MAGTFIDTENFNDTTANFIVHTWNRAPSQITRFQKIKPHAASKTES